MAIPLFQVDAFTNHPFSGNPAAVCLLSSPRDDDWMQAVAAEMNLSETAFVVIHDQDAQLDLRWFTPTMEVDLCGHATLAAAHALWSSHRVSNIAKIQFATKSGLLECRQVGDWIEMDFPVTPVSPQEAPAELCEALGVQSRRTARSPFDWLIEMPDEKAVRNISPDFQKLAKVKCRGAIVTARSEDPQFDFVSRFFAPASGINEDPVTGAAHCALVDFWEKPLGKSTFVARQISKRGGVVSVRREKNRAILAGQAMTVITGELCD